MLDAMISDTLDKVEQACDLSELQAVTMDFMQFQNIRCHRITVIHQNQELMPKVLYDHDETNWRDHYFNNEYYKIDPIFDFILAFKKPCITWADLKDRCNDRELRIFKEAERFGLVDGIILCFWSQSGDLFVYMISDGQLLNDRRNAERLRVFKVVGKQILEQSAYLYESLKSEWVPKLSPRQKQVKDLILRGCSNKEISKQLGIADKTVEIHVSKILSAYRVCSRVKLLPIIKNEFQPRNLELNLPD